VADIAQAPELFHNSQFNFSMKGIFLFLVVFINVSMMAQSPVTGNYQFHRQEMVAGFNFSSDWKFEFFYSYGAVDRSATGSFSISGDTLHLKSDKEAGKDFTIKSQSEEGKGYRIQFEDANKYLLSNIRCSFFIGTERKDEFTNQDGLVETELPHCDKIYVYHQLFPDMVTIVKDEKNNNNRFTLTLNPSLGQVSFKGVDFKIESDQLTPLMSSYIFPMEGVKFVKQ
jgi:hypothetical protein